MDIIQKYQQLEEKLREERDQLKEKLIEIQITKDILQK